MYLSSTRKFSARWLVSVCEAELCPEHTGETHTWEDTSGNIWEQGNTCPPFSGKGYPGFRCYLMSVYHSTEHLVSVSAWNSSSCTGTLSKFISICMWHSLNYHTQTFLVWTAFRHSATSLCRPDLSDPRSKSHVGHCNHLSKKKKISREQTGMNSSLMWLCPVHCTLHWL